MTSLPLTGHKFWQGDTVRVLESYSPDESLHGLTGVVSGYSDRPVYAVVILHRGGAYFFLDDELELVTECPACGGVDPDCASCEARM